MKIESTYAVCYTGNKERHSRLLKEFERVGLEKPYVVWMYPSPYRNFVLHRIPHIGTLDRQPGCWGATIGHYRVVKIAYELGQDNILIVEDDCRFLKDCNVVFSTLNCAPDDADCLMLDSVERERLEGAPTNGWQKVGKSFSTGCYIVNRKMMKRLIEMYESPVSGLVSRPMMRCSDHWTDTNIIGKEYRIYCAVPNLAIQVRCGDVNNAGESVYEAYAKIGLTEDKFSSYAEY